MGSGGAQNTGGITPPEDDQGQGDGTDVITIGDSYMFWFGEGIQRSLEKISGQTYRKYGMPGTFVLDEAIPSQYIKAWEEDADIKTVIMTGGGNDILASDCNPCDALVDQTAARLQQLRERMGDDGVRDVIVVGYGYPERPRGPEVPAALDYYRELMGEQCLKDGPPPRCHFVDPSAVLVGRLRAIGGHPDVEGNDAMARMIWERLQAEGIRR